MVIESNPQTNCSELKISQQTSTIWGVKFWLFPTQNETFFWCSCGSKLNLIKNWGWFNDSMSDEDGDTLRFTFIQRLVLVAV